MNTSNRPEILQIKKYPNRRYYDTTRSCHVTLQELYDLVLSGQDVCIADSKTETDITNLVLFQILLEKEQPKLDVFPSAMLHLMIRSNRQVLRSSLERFFGPFMDLFAKTQKQFETYWRRAMSGQMISPLDWANSMAQVFTPTYLGSKRDQTFEDHPALDEQEGSPSADSVDGTVDELRRQVGELTQRIEELSGARIPSPSSGSVDGQ